jgi:hypothetical protein
MDYEKRYNEALDRAKKLKETCDSTAVIGWCEYIFSELKESDEEIKKALIALVKCNERSGYTLLNNVSTSSMINWVEKQGKETISQSYLAPKSASQAIKEIITDNANKVEPKFKVGDWVVFNGLTLYINEVLKGYYRTISKSGIPNSYDWNIDNTARLWTIQDAKDGDVLAGDSCIFIIQKFGGINAAAKTYCTLFNDGEFNDGTILYFDIDSTKPATKEQRDLLFQKMKEAGYEWDADKKELKKIEQKPVKKTSCDRCKNVQSSHSCQDIAELGRCYLEHEKQGEQKPTWSKEDEKKRTLLMKILEVNHPHGLFKVNLSETMRTEELVSWLKSLNYKI